MEAAKHNLDLTEGVIWKKFLLFLLPIAIGTLFQQFYSTVDAVIVGQFVGADALAAVGGSAAVIVQLVVGIFTGLSSGATVVISHGYGAGDKEKLHHAVHSAVAFSLLAGAIITVVGILLTPDALRWTKNPQEIMGDATLYLRLYFLGTIPTLLFNMGAGILRAVGDAKRPLYYLVVCCLMNVVLDLLFVAGLHMGVAGAAWATIFSQFVSFCLLIAGTFRGGNLRLNLRDFSPSLKYYQNIVKGGAPSLFRQGLGSFATVCLNLMAGPYGDAAIAAMSIVTRISQFAASVVIGFGQGFQPVCGFNYGAKLFKRVQEGFWFCVKFCTSVLLVAAVCGWIFSPNLIGIFLKTDPLVIEYGSQALRLQALTFPLVGWITIANMMLQTIGKTVKASLLAMSRQFLFFVPVILTLPGFLGILGVQLSQPIADFCSFLLAVPLSISVLREMSHEQEQLEQLKITREN